MCRVHVLLHGWLALPLQALVLSGQYSLQGIGPAAPVRIFASMNMVNSVPPGGPNSLVFLLSCQGCLTNSMGNRGDPAAMARLTEAAEAAKRALSGAEAAAVDLVVVEARPWGAV